MRNLLGLFGLSLLAAGCAGVGPVGFLYTNVAVPYQWRAATPAEVTSLTTLGPVEGESCATNILGLAAYGDSGYEAAAQAAMKQRSGTTALYDVRVDSKVFSVLGIYGSYCTRVTGIAATSNPVSSAPGEVSPSQLAEVNPL